MNAVKAFYLWILQTVHNLKKKKILAMRMEIFSFRGGVGILSIIKCESLLLISMLTFRYVKAIQKQPSGF